MGAIRQRWYWFEFKCQQCGADARATRKDARFCGARCRVAWNRAQAPQVDVAPTVAAPSPALEELREVWGPPRKAKG